MTKMLALRKPAHLGLVVLLTCVLSPAAQSQSARPGGSTNAQAALQLRQLAAERMQLEAENARLKKELDALRKERDAKQGALDAAERRARTSVASSARAESARDKLQRDLDLQRSRTQELVDKFRDTVQQLREVETTGAATKQTLAQVERDLGSCVERNTALYKLTDEVLDRLERRGSFGLAASVEPFTRLKRTELENFVDDYRYRAEEQRVPAPAPPRETR